MGGRCSCHQAVHPLLQLTHLAFVVTCVGYHNEMHIGLCMGVQASRVGFPLAAFNHGRPWSRRRSNPYTDLFPRLR